MVKKVFLFVVTLLFLGCSSKEINHYVFDYTPPKDVSYDESKPLIAIEEIVLPSYIDRVQIVTRDNSSISVKEVEYWAGSLKEEIQKILTQTLQKNSSKALFISYPWREPWQEDGEILVKVIRFDSEISGDTNLVVRWSYVDKVDSIVLISETITLTQKNGATLLSIVEAQRDLLVKLANRISKKIEDKIGK